jgi:hypothetical protein
VFHHGLAEHEIEAARGERNGFAIEVGDFDGEAGRKLRRSR